MSFERRKVRVGKVVSDKMDKTVVVQVEWRSTHPVYRKSIRRRTRFNAHDEQNLCQVGDLIRIIETRPLSRTKRWRVTEILSREEIAEVQPEEIVVDESVATAAGLASMEEEPTAAAVAQEQEAPEAVPEEVEVSAATVEEAPEAVQEEPETPTAMVEKEETPKPQRRRRTTKAAARKEAGAEAPALEVKEEESGETEEEVAEAPTAVVGEEAVAEPEVQEAPKPRRRRTRKATVKEEKAVEEVDVPAAVVGEEETAQPDRVRAESSEAPAQDEAGSESGGGEGEEEETQK